VSDLNLAEITGSEIETIRLPDDFRTGMAGVQCCCGRFLSRARPVIVIRGEGYSRGECLSEVRGDCGRCGEDVPAGQGWWLAWDAWFE
jgi:hypothetical protein